MSVLSCRLLAAAALLAALALVPGKARAETYATCAGFIDSLPATISKQGVWCLRANLSTAISTGSAITVAANNVTIDCNDFKIGGLAGGEGSFAMGIKADGKQNITVRHCNIRGFYWGVYLTGAGHLVEDNRFDNNLHCAILVNGDNNLVQRNRVYDTGGLGMVTSYIGIQAEAHVIDNTVAGVFGRTSNTNPQGIQFSGVGNVARGNRVSGLQVAGTGEAIGVRAISRGTRVEGNHVVAPPGTNGAGIRGASNESDTICNNNITSGFSTPMERCVDNWGNVDL